MALDSKNERTNLNGGLGVWGGGCARGENDDWDGQTKTTSDQR